MDLMEALIVQNLKEGNEHAYKYVFDAHYDVLCVIAVRYLHDDFMAESVVGHAFSDSAVLPMGIL